MKRRELVLLLNRAAAALETPNDLTEEEKAHVVEDLAVAAEEFTIGEELTGDMLP